MNLRLCSFVGEEIQYDLLHRMLEVLPRALDKTRTNELEFAGNNARLYLVLAKSPRERNS